MEIMEQQTERLVQDSRALLQRCLYMVPESVVQVPQRAVVVVWGTERHDIGYVKTTELLRGSVARSDVYDGMYTCVVDVVGDLAHALLSVGGSLLSLCDRCTYAYGGF